MVGGADFIEHFQFGETNEFLHGLAGLMREGLHHSMEEEFRENDGGKWLAEY